MLLTKFSLCLSLIAVSAPGVVWYEVASPVEMPHETIVIHRGPSHELQVWTWYSRPYFISYFDRRVASPVGLKFPTILSVGRATIWDVGWRRESLEGTLAAKIQSFHCGSFGNVSRHVESGVTVTSDSTARCSRTRVYRHDGTLTFEGYQLRTVHGPRFGVEE